jgi:hypothetical protein
VYAGTSEENSKILIWDISTKMSLKEIVLNGMISVRMFDVEENMQYMAVIVLNGKAELILMFIEIET